MARPTKTGIDYFPLDVETEDKIKLIEAKYGMVGFAVWIKLLQKIYKHGYYIALTEEKILLFSNEINVNINKLNEIINDCLKWGVFDKKLKENYGILTSRGIQKRYFKATGRREEVEVDSNYLLVNGNFKKENWVYVNKNDNNDTVNVDKNLENDNKSTQSKVKENKEKKNKEQLDVPYQKIKELYNQTCGGKLPSVRTISDRRRKHLRARWREEGNLEVFKELFNRTISSKFLTGDNDRNWKADFDWLIKNDTNFNKVLEGKYNEEEKRKEKPKEMSQEEMEEKYYSGIPEDF